MSTPHTAVAYLRASHADQTDQRRSTALPGQRDVVARKAEELDATVVREFTYARPMDHNNDDGMRALLAYVAERDIDYCIIPAIDKLARIGLDSAVISAELRSRGVALVSANEGVDDTPAGRLQRGIMTTLAEWYATQAA